MTVKETLSCKQIIDIININFMAEQLCWIVHVYLIKNTSTISGGRNTQFHTSVKVEILLSQNTPLQVKVLNSDVTQVKVQKYYQQNVLKV